MDNIISLDAIRKDKRRDELLRLRDKLAWFMDSNLFMAPVADDTRVSIDKILAEIEADDAQAIVRGRAPVQFFWADVEIIPKSKPASVNRVELEGSSIGRRVALCGSVAG
jgi:hypothetical protein